MELIKKTVLHTSYQIFAKIISLSLGLYITALLTHQLTLSQFSEYVVLMTTMLQLVSFLEWGSGYVSVREAATKPHIQSQIFSSLLCARAVGLTIVLGILLLLGSFSVFSYKTELFIILLFPISTTTLKNLLTSIFHSKENFIAITTMEIVSSIVYSGLIYFFLKAFPSTNTTFILLGTATTIGTIFTATVFRNQINLQFKPSVKIAKQILKYSLPVGAQLLIFNIYNRFDTFFLQLYHGDSVVGFYGLSYKIYENTLMIAAFTMTSLYPVLAKSAQNTRKITIQALMILLTIACIGGTFLNLFALQLINLINPEYQIASNFLKILSFAIPFAYVNHVTGFTLTAINKQHAFLYFAIIALVVNITTNYLFIPEFGATASSYITVLTEFSISITSIIYLLHVTRQKSPNQY